MRKIIRFLIAVCFVAILIALGWYIIDATTASSPGAMPGTGSIKDEASAIAVGRAVALGELTSDSLDTKVLPLKVKKMSEVEFAQALTVNGDRVEVRSILGSEPNQEVWSVTFSGAFSPKRALDGMGTKAPVYAKIDILLAAKDGMVIGVHMYEEVTQK